MSWKEKIIKVFKPSTKFSIFILITIGIFTGVGSVIVFEVGMAATNTEEFCAGCHLQPGATADTYYTSTHYKNKTGVRPICSDCHVPKEFGHKMWRKIIASKEVVSDLMGNIDTTEKYLLNVKHMRDNEIARLKANDSKECRNCHEADHMVLELQTAKAQEFHSTMKKNNKTCIDCHQGLVHMSPMVAKQLEEAH